MSMAQTIGFIGLGRMGGPMATRLAAAGHALVVQDVSAGAAAALVAKGATEAADPEAVADAADVVMVSLPTPDIVRAVALGPRGVAAGRRAKIFVDLSTTGPEAAAEIAAALGGRGIVAVDAPVSGGVGGAVKGTLAVMVAGPAATVEALRPALSVLGKVFHVGEKPGLGQTMKLANNLLSAAAMALSSEAMVFGVKAGLDPAVMLDVINAGSGRNTATEAKFPRAILTRSFDFGFAAGLMHKDVRLFVEEAARLGVKAPAAEAVHALWQRTVTELGPEKDFTAIVQIVEKDAGVEVRGKT